MASAAKTKYGYNVERYYWNDGKITRIDHTFDSGTVQRYEIGYAAGLVKNVALLREGKAAHDVFVAKPPKVATLLAALRSRLPNDALEQLKVAGERRTVFCLVLSYSSASAEEMALPSITLGLEQEREAWRASGNSAEALWNPANFELHDSDQLELKSPDLEELAASVALTLRTPKHYAAVRKVYVAAAKSLSEMNLGALLSITADFQVIATDVDMSDLTKNLRAIAGAKTTRTLQRRGLL
jgi:hypothetical protein